MNVTTILFPTDFSSKGDQALEFAEAMARQHGAKLLIVHVAEPPVAYGEGMYYYGVPEPDIGAMKAMLGKLKPQDLGVPFEHHLLEGNPATEIARFAKEKNVDLIVMSSHGRTGLGRLLMGSVAESVTRDAECPVLIVKPKAATSPEKPLAAAV